MRYSHSKGKMLDTVHSWFSESRMNTLRKTPAYEPSLIHAASSLAVCTVSVTACKGALASAIEYQLVESSNNMVKTDQNDEFKTVEKFQTKT